MDQEKSLREEQFTHFSHMELLWLGHIVCSWLILLMIADDEMLKWWFDQDYLQPLSEKGVNYLLAGIFLYLIDSAAGWGYSHWKLASLKNFFENKEELH